MNIVQIKNVSKDFIVERGLFKSEGGIVKALDNISFEVGQFETLGIVGESGSGKTTLAKVILDLIKPTSGEVVFNSSLINNFRKDVQIIFQNPYNSLNPKMRIIDILSEPLLIHKIVEKGRFHSKAMELLNMVGLENSVLGRYPIEFSGGQRQRICIARSLASNPKFLVLDEPISSLDLTIQAEMLELFTKLKRELSLTYIFISHNLAVIKYLSDKVIVMQNGRIVEQNSSKAIFSAPMEEYTQNLLKSII
ncbi:MAG: ATP-binding cassette domain-containing protein [Candidatus Omnitrophica bacterium]|nr:ATP-binding cassette domain-containing protein [Candidatus Omnitrophota bacterium]